MSSSPSPQQDAESKQATVIAVAVVFAALASIVVSLRLYTRLCILRAAGADDWTILAANVRFPLSFASSLFRAVLGL